MQLEQRLAQFFDAAANDPHIGSPHISLYVAILFLLSDSLSIVVHREELMQLSKIRSRHSCYKYLRTLHEKGYIIYIPSKEARAGIELRLV